MNPADRRDKGINQLQDDLSRQQRRIRELEAQLADAANGNLPKEEWLDPDTLWTEPTVSAKTFEPLVILRWFTHLAQISPQAARDMAMHLIDCAAAAEADAAAVKLFQSVDMEPSQLAAMLAEFRNHREQVLKTQTST